MTQTVPQDVMVRNLYAIAQASREAMYQTNGSVYVEPFYYEARGMWRSAMWAHDATFPMSYLDDVRGDYVHRMRLAVGLAR